MSSGFIAESSPSQTALSESQLHKKALCDYVVNVADGCRHGCQFCYVASMPQIWGDPGDKFEDAGIEDPSGEWGGYSLYRVDLSENLAKDCQRLEGDWRRTRRGQGVVGMSFATDCYMDARAAEITEQAVMILTGHQRSVRILTRNPKLAADLHGELLGSLGRQGLVTVGASIPTVRQDEVAAIESQAPPIEHRFRGLEALEAEGVPTYVSMSPTYPTHGPDALRETMEEIDRRLSPTVVFHEPINPRGGNFDACIQGAREAGEEALAEELERVRSGQEWRHYAVQQMRAVQEIGEDLGLPVHLWPDDRLLEELDERSAAYKWLVEWRRRPSPEEIGLGVACDDPYPEGVFSLDGREQSSIDSFV